MKYKITIELKKEILNPEARAIKGALAKNHVHTLKDLSIAKQFTVELDRSVKNPDETVEELTKNHLANTLSENYSIERLDP